MRQKKKKIDTEKLSDVTSVLLKLTPHIFTDLGIDNPLITYDWTLGFDNTKPKIDHELSNILNKHLILFSLQNAALLLLNDKPDPEMKKLRSIIFDGMDEKTMNTYLDSYDKLRDIILEINLKLTKYILDYGADYIKKLDNLTPIHKHGRDV